MDTESNTKIGFSAGLKGNFFQNGLENKAGVVCPNLSKIGQFEQKPRKFDLILLL